MKMIPYLIVAGIVLLTSCDTPIDPDINTLRAVAADKSQPDYIRKSIQYYDDFFQGKKVLLSTRSKAEAELSATRTEATLNCLIAVLNSLEKRLPEPLPTENDVNELNKKFGDSKDVEYEINPVFIVGHFSNLIKIITYYDEEKGDSEVQGFLKRFEAKYGKTSSGEYWLKDFRMELKHASADRAGHNGKWKSGRKQMGLEPE